MQACPLYLSELAPAHLRGSFNICFQLATAVGILAANCLNYGKSARKTEIFSEYITCYILPYVCQCSRPPCPDILDRLA